MWATFNIFIEILIFFNCTYYKIKTVFKSKSLLKTLRNIFLSTIFLNLPRKICRWGRQKNVVLRILWSVLRTVLPNTDLKFEGCCRIYGKHLYTCTAAPKHYFLYSTPSCTHHVRLLRVILGSFKISSQRASQNEFTNLHFYSFILFNVV